MSIKEIVREVLESVGVNVLGDVAAMQIDEDEIEWVEGDQK